MTIIKNSIGIIWLVITVTGSFLLFMNFGNFQKFLYKNLHLRTDESFTGGGVVYTIKHNSYETRIHEPVFTGLFKERNDGFFQIDWIGELPDNIAEYIDYDNNGNNDMYIELDTVNNEVNNFLSFDSKIESVMDRTSITVLKIYGRSDHKYAVFAYNNGRSVRVILKK